MQRRLHTVVDMQNYDTMASRGAAPYRIVSMNNSCPDSFSHALMSGGVAASLQTPRKQDSDFWVYHKRKGCLFTLCTSSFCSVGFSFSEMSRVIATLTKKETNKKKNSQRLLPLPPNKLIISNLLVIPLLHYWVLVLLCAQKLLTIHSLFLASVFSSPNVSKNCSISLCRVALRRSAAARALSVSPILAWTAWYQRRCWQRFDFNRTTSTCSSSFLCSRLRAQGHRCETVGFEYSPNVLKRLV